MKKSILLWTILFLFPVLQVIAIENIYITRGISENIPIAINYFETDGAGSNRIASSINTIINNDLTNCGLFRIISPAAFIEKKRGTVYFPLFSAWKQINATLLLNGSIRKIKEDRYEVSFILWDVLMGKDIIGQIFETNTNSLRRVAHKIADKIYERMTGDIGYFDTRIAYISESGPMNKRIRKLAIMDQDGANHHFLTDGKNIVLTPRFSPKGDRILYLSYRNRTPQVYMRNLYTGKDILIGTFPGMSFAPKFSPDGSKALMSIARNGATNIIEINLRAMKVTKLTDNIAINTSPSYSPDGKSIVFNSDRSGSRQLYTMNSDGSNVQRISFGNGVYATPVWSPTGNDIAFTKITRNFGFIIGVMKPNGSEERLIAKGYLVEGPTFSPNGRMIMYTKEDIPQGKNKGKSKIYMIDIGGFSEREVRTPQDASDPDWSFLLD